MSPRDHGCRCCWRGSPPMVALLLLLPLLALGQLHERLGSCSNYDVGSGFCGRWGCGGTFSPCDHGWCCCCCCWSCSVCGCGGCCCVCGCGGCCCSWTCCVTPSERVPLRGRRAPTTVDALAGTSNCHTLNIEPQRHINGSRAVQERPYLKYLGPLLNYMGQHLNYL